MGQDLLSLFAGFEAPFQLHLAPGKIIVLDVDQQKSFIHLFYSFLD
jgi:hypothetical protein